jgi:hypothetical protein
LGVLLNKKGGAWHPLFYLINNKLNSPLKAFPYDKIPTQNYQSCRPGEIVDSLTGHGVVGEEYTADKYPHQPCEIAEIVLDAAVNAYQYEYDRPVKQPIRDINHIQLIQQQNTACQHDQCTQVNPVVIGALTFHSFHCFGN